jgi:predicted RNA-binding Zn-ribbon protein involved in translation (DUF1610 family)
MDERWRFFNSEFSKCSKCGEEAKDMIQETRNVEACRMNGDAYGVVEFSCQKCGWKTSFKFDEAADVYYFETSSWKVSRDFLFFSSSFLTLLFCFLLTLPLPRSAFLFPHSSFSSLLVLSSSLNSEGSKTSQFLLCTSGPLLTLS